MIIEGKAYMDDTEQEKMQKERLSFINSYRRDSLPEENLKIFEAMLAGKKGAAKGEVDATKFCLRAKIDMQSPNGTLRDPVLYRFNDTPHHRTGKAFHDTCTDIYATY
jgi:glutamyl-tRNA synthetase